MHVLVISSRLPKQEHGSFIFLLVGLSHLLMEVQSCTLRVERGLPGCTYISSQCQAIKVENFSSTMFCKMQVKTGCNEKLLNNRLKKIISVWKELENIQHWPPKFNII